MTNPGPLSWIHEANANRPLDYTETGLVKRFVNEFGKFLKYDAESGIIYIWADAGTHWEPDYTDQLFEMTEQVISMLQSELEFIDEGNRNNLLDVIKRASTRSMRNNIMMMVRSQPGIKTLGFTEQPRLLATPTGTVNLNTGQLRASDPSDMLTACTEVPYVPNASSQFLDDQLNIFLPDEDVRQLFWDFLGASILGGNPLRVMGLFIGPTTSGKSMIMEAVKKTLGKYVMPVNSSIFRGNLDDKPRPDLMKAMKARIVYASEGAKVWDLHGDQIKRITGQDTLPLRNMYKEIVHVTPNFTPIIVCNEMPGIKGADLALKRRILPIKFEPLPDYIPENPNVRAQFVNDRGVQQAVLAKIIEGAQSDIAQHGINLKNVNAMTQQLIQELFEGIDIYAMCIKDLMESGYIAQAPENTPIIKSITANDLYRLYENWMTHHGGQFDKKEKVNPTAFGRAMKERNYRTQRAGDGVHYLDFVIRNVPSWLRVS